MGSAEHSVHLVGLNRLRAVESLVVCIVGKIVQDVGIV